ncbi:MAG: hypothetical protein CMN30_01765 [Sandaracinus sp.]|nr:hypothetical protein [Sandaracinus sp.]|tara:strand:- start:239 stop:814 length:576 start_codon:yes stop_codon:yes gene_type:complete
MEPARRRGAATYDDLLALPEDARAEVVRGEVLMSPAPLPRHSKVQRAIARFIGGPFDDDDGRGGPGGWWILLEVDVRLSEHDIVRPDLAGWRRQRLPKPWDQRPIDVVPDWVCEVLSPSTMRHDRLTKARLYREAGVPSLWLIDPEARLLEAFQLRDESWVEAARCGDEDTLAIPPFGVIDLEVARLFPPE